MLIGKDYWMGFSSGKYFINNGKELIILEAKTLQAAQKEAEKILLNK